MVFKKVFANAINYQITDYRPLVSQLRLVSLWVLICFVQVGLILSAYDNFSFASLLTPSTLLWLLIFFLLFVELSFAIAYVSAFAFWVGAKCLKGRGTLFKTCSALLLAVVYTVVPFALFFTLLKLGGPFGFILKNIFRLGMFASIFLGLAIMLKGLAKAHNLSFGNAFCAFTLGIIILMPMVLFAIFLAKTYGGFDAVLRTLLTTFAGITPGCAIILTLLAYSKAKKSFLIDG